MQQERFKDREKVATCRNAPKPWGDSHPVNGQLWIVWFPSWFSTCSHCCLAKEKVCSCDRRVPLVQIKFWAERGKKIVYFSREAPKGVCIDLRTNDCQCVQVCRKKKSSWGRLFMSVRFAGGEQIECGCWDACHFRVYRGGRLPFRERCLIDQVARMSKYELSGKWQNSNGLKPWLNHWVLPCRSRGGTLTVPNGSSQLFVYISARAYIYMMGYVCSRACRKPGSRHVCCAIK